MRLFPLFPKKLVEIPFYLGSVCISCHIAEQISSRSYYLFYFLVNDYLLAHLLLLIPVSVILTLLLFRVLRLWFDYSLGSFVD